MGDYRPEYLFTLKQSLDGYRYYQKLIAELDDEIARLMHTLPNATEHPAPIPKRTKRTAYQRMGNDPLFDLRSELYRIAGVDLTDIPGVSAIAAQVVSPKSDPMSVDSAMPPLLPPGLGSVRINESAAAKCSPPRH